MKAFLVSLNKVLPSGRPVAKRQKSFIARTYRGAMREARKDEEFISQMPEGGLLSVRKLGKLKRK